MWLTSGRTKRRAAIFALRLWLLGWLSGTVFVENKGDDWVRSFSFRCAEAALAVTASRDGNGTPHAGLIVAWGCAQQRIRD
jgi:hypothetical protein